VAMPVTQETDDGRPPRLPPCEGGPRSAREIVNRHDIGRAGIAPDLAQDGHEHRPVVSESLGSGYARLAVREQDQAGCARRTADQGLATSAVSGCSGR
jgi:hypothetical protein